MKKTTKCNNEKRSLYLVYDFMKAETMDHKSDANKRDKDRYNLMLKELQL